MKFVDIFQIKVPSDCIACVLRPLLTVASILGPYCTCACCPHSKYPTETIKFVKSKRQTIVLSVSVSLMTVVTLLTVFEFSTFSNPTKSMFLSTEIIFSTGSVLICIFSNININFKLTELNGLAAIIDNRRYYGFGSILDEEAAKGYIRKSYWMEISCLLSGTSCITYVFYQESHTGLIVIILKTIVIVLDMLVQTIIFCQHLVEMSVYQFMFKKCFENLKRVLMLENDNRSENVNFIMSELLQALPKKRLKLVSLQRLNNLYMSLIWNHRHLQAFLQPTMMIIWLMMVIVSIAHFYTLLLMYDGEVEADPFLELRTYGTIFSAIIIVITAEGLHNEVSFFAYVHLYLLSKYYFTSAEFNIIIVV